MLLELHLSILQIRLLEVSGETSGCVEILLWKGLSSGILEGGSSGDAVSEAAVVLFWSRE